MLSWKNLLVEHLKIALFKFLSIRTKIELKCPTQVPFLMVNFVVKGKSSRQAIEAGMLHFKMAALCFFGVTVEVIKSTKDAFKCGVTLFKQKI